MKLSLWIPSHLKCVTTLPCEMSDDALKPARTLTGCVINVDRARDVWLPNLNALDYHRLLRQKAAAHNKIQMPFNRWSINVDDSRQSTS